VVRRAVTPAHADYPAGLRALPDPPANLHAAGLWPVPARAIAIVGSRAATGYGLAVARRLAADLAGLGYAVVSGLARGVDAAAHRGALAAGGSTLAVLPGGLDAITPRDHEGLAREIARRGTLLSEWPASLAPRAGLFVRRNRLIAALALGTVVVEAAERSGALSTAAAARRLGRPLLAVPGDIDRPTSRGCNALLRAGAAPCESAGDVVRAVREAASGARAAGGVAPAEARLLEALGEGPRPAEQLAEAAGLGLEEALAALLRLEWSGVARAHPGQRWSRCGGRTG
jgi:DNA processing protein